MVVDDAVKTILSEAVNEGTDMVTLYYAVVAQSFLGIKGITVYILKTSNDMFQCVAVVAKKKCWDDISSLLQDPFSQKKSKGSFKRKYFGAPSD